MNFTKLSNAIRTAINAGCELNVQLAALLDESGQKDRTAILSASAKAVASAYSQQSGEEIHAYPSRKGGLPTFGAVSVEQTYISTPASEAARRWFQRNIMRSGFFASVGDKPAKQSDKVAMLAERIRKMSKADKARLLRLIGQ